MQDQHLLVKVTARDDLPEDAALLCRQQTHLELPGSSQRVAVQALWLEVDLGPVPLLAPQELPCRPGTWPGTAGAGQREFPDIALGSGQCKPPALCGFCLQPTVTSGNALPCRGHMGSWLSRHIALLSRVVAGLPGARSSQREVPLRAGERDRVPRKRL
ncbi:hypothetical protein TREES_T100020495 [Tupaia chinensis]|uniref:Uncharacterized protein n=1 Tax=Tupaia chinensis TaxID=246437 RepID=L9KW04_TUPCH|nr:hypothetical protein TREES_T100020495 [Tupaia chinensis]